MEADSVMTPEFETALSNDLDVSQLTRDELHLDTEDIEILTNDDQTISFTHPRHLETVESAFDLDRQHVDSSTLRTILRDVPLADHAIGVAATTDGVAGTQLRLLAGALNAATADMTDDLRVVFSTPDGNSPTAIGVQPVSEGLRDRFNAVLTDSLGADSGVVIVLPPFQISDDAIVGREKYDGIPVLEVDSQSPDEERGESSEGGELPTLTLSRIAAWGGAIVSALTLFNLQSPGNEVYLLLGAIAVSAPNTRVWIERLLGYELSRGMVAATVLLLWWGAGMLMI